MVRKMTTEIGRTNRIGHPFIVAMNHRIMVHTLNINGMNGTDIWLVLGEKGVLDIVQR